MSGITEYIEEEPIIKTSKLANTDDKKLPTIEQEKKEVTRVTNEDVSSEDSSYDMIHKSELKGETKGQVKGDLKPKVKGDINIEAKGDYEIVYTEDVPENHTVATPSLPTFSCTSDSFTSEDMPCCSKDVMNVSSQPITYNPKPPVLDLNSSVVKTPVHETTKMPSHEIAEARERIPKAKAIKLEKHKQLGNASFKSGDYATAIHQYTAAIQFALPYGLYCFHCFRILIWGQCIIR